MKYGTEKKSTEPSSNYHRSLRRDLVAGATVAAIALPQGMAYALIAGVPVEHGVYAGIIGTIVAALVGSSRHLVTGPVNAMSIVIASSIAAISVSAGITDPQKKLEFVFVLALLVGVMQVTIAVLKLGHTLHFVSEAVLYGFSAGAALLIAGKQLKHLVGLADSVSPTHFLPNELYQVFSSWSQVDVPTLTLGLATIAVTVLLRQIGRTFLSYIVAMVAMTLAAALLEGQFGAVKRIPEIHAAFPPFDLPDVSLKSVSLLWKSAVALSILGLVESTSIARGISMRSGHPINMNQEIMGQGASNIASSFFRCIPVAGSFSRTIINYQAGATSKMAAVISAVIVAIVLLVAAPLTGHIPLAVLSGLIIVAAAGVVPWGSLRLALRSTPADAVALVLTFVSTLVLDLTTAVYVGVGASVVFFLKHTSHVRLERMDPGGGATTQFDTIRAATQECHQLALFHVEGDLYFGASADFANSVREVVRSNCHVVILRMRRTRNVDLSALLVIEHLYRTLRAGKRHLLLSGVSQEFGECLDRSGLTRILGEENVFRADTASEILASTRDSVLRASAIVAEYDDCDHCRDIGGCRLKRVAKSF